MNIIGIEFDAFAGGDVTELTPTTEVDLTKAAIWLLSATTFNSSIDEPSNQMRLEFQDSTTVEANRQVTGGGAVCQYRFLTVEFPKAISVQFFSVTLNSTTSVNVAISSVDSSANRVLVIPSSSANSTGNTSDKECDAAITSDTNVEVTKGSSAGISMCNFFVVELPPL
ncbi:MAG: hypothetical protein GY787_31740 [Alteromonadales bacterium]|nr:hypothetical protein [Alteromonadales bacterium]